MSGTNDSITGYVSEMDFYKNGIHVKGTDRSIQQSKMVSNFLQMDVKVYRLSRIPFNYSLWGVQKPLRVFSIHLLARGELIARTI